MRENRHKRMAVAYERKMPYDEYTEKKASNNVVKLRGRESAEQF